MKASIIRAVKSEWGDLFPARADEPALTNEIHELMLFHIYD